MSTQGPPSAAAPQPVAAQCRFKGDAEWRACSIEHHLMVQAAPHEWQGYETRALYAEVPAPYQPTKEMIEAGAQRLVSWEEGCKWPQSWDKLTILAARQEAERVWLSMLSTWRESQEENSDD